MLDRILRYFKEDPRNHGAVQLEVPFGFTGMTLAWFKDTIPAGFVRLDGSVYEISQYPELFEHLGESFRVPNTETFVVPDLRNRVPVGVGSEAQFNELHKKTGSATHTMKINELVPHNHTVIVGFGGSNAANSRIQSGYVGSASGSSSRTTISNGGGQPFSIVQPSYAVHWIMKT